MRTAASAGLSALRIIEDESARGRGERICLRAGKEAAVYVLNKKRGELADIEQRYGVSIDILIDEGFEGARMTVDSSGPPPVVVHPVEIAIEEELDEETLEISLEDDEEEAEIASEDREDREDSEGSEGDRQARRRRRRRRGGRGRGRREGGETEAALQPEGTDELSGEREEQPTQQAEAIAEEPESGKRRRRRRGGKTSEPAAQELPQTEPDKAPMVERPQSEKNRRSLKCSQSAKSNPSRNGAARRRLPSPKPPPEDPARVEAPPAELVEQAAPPAKPGRKRRAKASELESAPAGGLDEQVSLPPANNDTTADEGEPRRGWWQRTFG